MAESLLIYQHLTEVCCNRNFVVFGKNGPEGWEASFIAAAVTT